MRTVLALIPLAFAINSLAQTECVPTLNSRFKFEALDAKGPPRPGVPLELKVDVDVTIAHLVVTEQPPQIEFLLQNNTLFAYDGPIATAYSTNVAPGTNVTFDTGINQVPPPDAHYCAWTSDKTALLGVDGSTGSFVLCPSSSDLTYLAFIPVDDSYQLPTCEPILLRMNLD